MQGSWNTKLIWQAFSTNDANQILRIPLSSRLPSDRLVWHTWLKVIFRWKAPIRWLFLPLRILSVGHRMGIIINASGYLCGDLIFLTRLSHSRGVRARIFIPRKRTCATEKCLTTRPAKFVVWKLRVLFICSGTVKNPRRFGRLLVFPLIYMAWDFRSL